MGWAEVPGTQQPSGADPGTRMWRLTAFLREVGSTAYTEKTPFSHPDLSQSPDASTESG